MAGLVPRQKPMKLRPEDRKAIAADFEARLADGGSDNPVSVRPEDRPPAPNPWLMRLVAGAILTALAAAIVAMLIEVL